jgi:hypothetical protein
MVLYVWCNINFKQLTIKQTLTQLSNQDQYVEVNLLEKVLTVMQRPAWQLELYCWCKCKGKICTIINLQYNIENFHLDIQKKIICEKT